MTPVEWTEDMWDAVVGEPCYTHRQYEKLRAENERLRAAIKRIDSINDNPARYNADINAVITALGEQGKG